MKHMVFKAVLILVSVSLKFSHLQILSEHINIYHQIIEDKKVKKGIDVIRSIYMSSRLSFIHISWGQVLLLLRSGLLRLHCEQNSNIAENWNPSSSKENKDSVKIILH